PDFDADQVVAEANSVLTTAFGVTERPFGGLVTEAEILSLIQSVEGVIAASVTELRKESDPPSLRRTAIQAASAHPSAGGTGAVVRAQVAVLALGNPTLGTMAP